MSPFSRQASVQSTAVGFDAGLRAWMLNVYNYMASALLLTGVVAYVAGNSPAFLGMMFTQGANGAMAMSPLGWVLMLAPLGMAIYLGMRIQSMSLSTAKTMFWLYAGVMGASLCFIFLVYTSESIARTFFITSATFGVMSLVGYTTKRDLTSFGSFLMMGVIGLVIASLVNIFMQSSMMSFVISVISVFVFTGLIAYDTQKLKQMYYAVGGSGEASQKTAIMGALSLYLDFINLFVSLLRLIGDRR